MTNMEESAGSLTVDVWVDVMCPFCFFATTALQRALTRFPHAGGIRVEHHSFQLLPDLPADRSVSLHEHFRDQHGASAAEASATSEQVAQRGADLGLTLRPDRTKVTNTRAAHRLLKHAAANEVQPAMLQRLFLGYFQDGLDVGDVEQLPARGARGLVRPRPCLRGSQARRARDAHRPRPAPHRRQPSLD